MKYNTENINIENGIVFFWGHQPSKNGEITNSCFSQWWQSSFFVNGIEYKTAEHWMMAKKAELFDKAIVPEILSTQNPIAVKKLGRKIQNYSDEIWMEKRYQIVKEGNIYKFSQNPKLIEFLLKTENKIIVEASPVDPIWGIGLAADRPEAKDPKKWMSLNLLGFALMEVRDEIELNTKH